MNATVTATGMNVKATSSKNLIISTNDTIGGEEDISKASTYTTAVLLSPASCSTLAGSQNFFKNTNTDNIDYITGVASTGTTFASVTPATSGSTANVVKHTFYIRADDADSTKTFTNLYVSAIGVTDTENSNSTANANISKALRVGVVCGTNGFIYAPVAGATASYQAVKAAGEVKTIESDVMKNASGEAMSESTTPLTTCDSSNILATSVTVGAYTQVDIYIWYEGQDASCTSANAVTVESLNVEVIFSAN